MAFLSRFLLALLPQVVSGGVWMAGVNIAGFDFGCPDNTGVFDYSLLVPPLASLGNADGAAQMQWFVEVDGLNVFRLPVCWQYLVNNVPGGDLYADFIGTYDELVGACLSTGAHCVIDIHNYARWDGNVIGQSATGSPTNDDFASLWSQIAAKYAGQPNIVFGVMNEPHDLDLSAWVTTVQYAVTAIRNAGASSQMILIPGSAFSAVVNLTTDDFSVAEQLSAVVNPDGSHTGIIYDIHQYLDTDVSGRSDDCVIDSGISALDDFATYLRSVGRQAFLTETGGGSTDSCYTALCAELDLMNYNADVYLGWIGWAAGSFTSSYVLTETPVVGSDGWYNTEIVSSCIAGKFEN